MQAIAGTGLTPTAARTGKGKRPKLTIEDGLTLPKLYPFNCSFYEDPPLDSISLQDFEDYAVARLTFLRIIERHNMTSNIKFTNDWLSGLRSDVKKSKSHLVNTMFLQLVEPNKSSSSDAGKQAAYEEQLAARKIDNISHFLLRLAFCRTEDLRKWMTSLEVDFFRLKFRLELRNEMQKFLKYYDLNYNTIDIVGDDKLRNNLLATYFAHVDSQTIDSMDFYKVPFTQVLDLVKLRKVYLKSGEAIIPHNELDIIVSSRFRSKLSQLLAMTCKAMPIVEEDERLVRLLTDFDKRYTGSAYVQKGSQGSGVSAAMLDDLSKKSFPLCMKNLYDVVVQEHHLKHWGRLQLGLFFKAVNLSMDEATKFWRNNFTKKAGMDGGRFDKQYLYNIRHMYGQEGKRADYTPYSCMKIIMSSAGPGDHHGCPFRHSDAIPLRVKLNDAMIPASGIKEILELVEQKHYQIACQKYFEFTHGKATIEGGVNHPNQYFEESQAVIRGGNKSDPTKNKKLPTTVSKQYPKREIKKELDSNDVVTDMDISNMLSDDDEFLSQEPESQISDD